MNFFGVKFTFASEKKYMQDGLLFSILDIRLDLEKYFTIL
jgi:hypothetical protein